MSEIPVKWGLDDRVIGTAIVNTDGTATITITDAYIVDWLRDDSNYNLGVFVYE